MKRLFLLTLALMVASALTASAASITIDNFTDYMHLQLLGSGGTTATVNQGPLTGVLGGLRTSTLTRSDASTFGSGHAYIESGSLDIITSASVKTTALLHYGYGTVLNADFSSLGAAGYFLLKDWGLDGGTVDATLTLTSGATTKTTSVSLGNTPGDVKIAFSQFNGINFSDIDEIRLQFANNNNGQDFSLTGFSAEGTSVPDGGATLMLLGVALTGLGAVRRKLGA